MRISTVVGLSLLVILQGSALSLAEVLPDWPEFRGPTGQGIAHRADPPLTWNQTDNVVWKQAIPGRGWSSPIVYRNSIYQTLENGCTVVFKPGSPAKTGGKSLGSVHTGVPGRIRTGPLHSY